MTLPADPLSVVCFGDSLTWGFNPADRSRYGHQVRWTRLLQRELGEGYYVIEEGLNGRTTVYEDPVAGDKNGLAHLETVLQVHRPIDILIMMLGTNNLKRRFNMNAAEIALSMERLVRLALKSEAGPEGRAPKVLLMAPPPANDLTGTVLEEFLLGETTREISRKIAPAYEQVAKLHGVGFFDTGRVVETSKIDGIHLDPETQPVLAKAVAQQVRDLA